MQHLLKPSRKTMHNDESGFTLVEMIIASGIIVASVTAFILFMTGVAGTQRSASLDRDADRALSQQVELLNGLSWDNLMNAPTGSYSDCTLDNTRSSTQAVRPGPETVTVDGMAVSIARTVTWTATGDPVTCSSTNKDRADTKTVTVTATWNDGSTQRTRSVSTVRSRWAETAPDPAGIAANQPTLFATVPVNSVANWSCVGSGGTVTSDGVYITAMFPATGATTCGYSVSGLTPGKVYSAVMDVFVPATAAPVELDANGVARGGIATPSGTWQTVTDTWIETSASRLIGPYVSAAKRPIGSNVKVRSITVYQF